jgi:hypothetical protein
MFKYGAADGRVLGLQTSEADILASHSCRDLCLKLKFGYADKAA